MSVQNLLLGLGASLLAGACVIFLVFTWDQMPLEVRALVIGVSTAVVLLAAWFADRRGLRATAEAVASLGAVMVLLDAWALRATGLVTGPGTSDYLALAALGSAAVLGAYARAVRLTSPRIV
ncbi:MAG: hypothetical protein ACTMIR_09990, partial [Cellulomonadaceae bacterium]